MPGVNDTTRTMPLQLLFRLEDGRWRTRLPGIRHALLAREVGAERFGRRSIAVALRNLRFGDLDLATHFALRREQLVGLRRLTKPPYSVEALRGLEDQEIDAVPSKEELEALSRLEWPEIARRLIGEVSGGARPRPGDFLLAFHLEAAEDDERAIELPFPSDSTKVRVDPYPVMTDDDVISTSVVEDPAGVGGGAVNVRFATGSAQMLRRISRENIGRKLVIVVDGEVVSTPVIRSEVGRNAMITGRFTREEVEAIRDRLDSWRAEGRKLLARLRAAAAAGPEPEEP